MGRVRDTDTDLAYDRNGSAVQVLEVETTVNISTTGVASNNNALPSGSQIVMVSATEGVWIKFGASGVTITAEEAGAILIPGGGVTIHLKSTDTHFAAIRVSTDGKLSVAKLV